jgi:uncharacterized protein YdaU (DUF1376 family)
MSKDPAFLFYSSDFLTGTLLMSMEQKGKFITLLCIQHQKGHMIEKDMLQICGTYDEDILSKFKKDNDGKFYNERLKEEVEKRKAYSESRRNNRKKKEDMIDTSKTYDEHMENENENKDLNKSKKVASFQKPTLEQVEEYMKERGMSNYASRFHNFYESKGWMVGKNKMKDWKAAVRNWEDDKKTAPKTEAPVLKVVNLSDYE